MAPAGFSRKAWERVNRILTSSVVALAGLLLGARSASADDPPSPPVLELRLAPVPTLAPPNLLPRGDRSSGGTGLSPVFAFEPLRLSLTSTLFPLAGGYPQCETLGDDVGNSIHGMPVQRMLFLRLNPCKSECAKTFAFAVGEPLVCQ